jgi:hypothetical protein
MEFLWKIPKMIVNFLSGVTFYTLLFYLGQFIDFKDLNRSAKDPSDAKQVEFEVEENFQGVSDAYVDADGATESEPVSSNSAEVTAQEPRLSAIPEMTTTDSVANGTTPAVRVRPRSIIPPPPPAGNSFSPTRRGSGYKTPKSPGAVKSPRPK